MTVVQKPGLYTAVQFNGSNGSEVYDLAVTAYGIDGDPSWAVENDQFVFRSNGGFITKHVPVDYYWVRGPYWGTVLSGGVEIVSPDAFADRFTGNV